jgi:signal transduction histidine kinase
VTRADGTVGWHLWMNLAILDANGNLVEFQGVGHDVTERHISEEALRRAESRSSAILRAIPDLMFVVLRDGTYIDYHARDVNLLFVPPTAFIGRKVREVLPPALAELMMDAIERAFASADPVVVDYELPSDEPRFYEARIVQKSADRVLAIVRDVTEAKRASELNRRLAGRLIARQDVERQRIARELHDDVNQRLALLNFEIAQIAAQTDAQHVRAQLDTLAAHVGEIATDVHNLAYELHPSRLQAIGLVASVQSLCRDALKGDVHVAFTHDAIPSSVDADVSLCVYRIIQEALHNVLRHSHARDAQVRLTYDGGGIVLQIADCGAGFDPKHTAGARLGLRSMEERVAALNGQFAVHGNLGEGTRIDVRIPLA